MSVKKILKKLILQRWNIGFTETSVEDIVDGKPIRYRWMQHSYKNRWFADPFLLDVTEDEYVVLAEDFEDERGYAVISKLVIDRKTMILKEVKQLLDRGTHLSFPIIIRKDGDIYVHPENSASGELNLYKYDERKDELIFDKTMMREPLTDAVTLDYGEKKWMFATTLPNPNGNELLVYQLEEEGYTKKDSVWMEGRKARMGGDFFWCKGKLYRPAQDNSRCYGGALILQEASLKNDEWNFVDVRTLTSPHAEYTTGLHTFNMYKGSIVVDVHGYRKHPWLSALITNCFNLFRIRR